MQNYTITMCGGYSFIQVAKTVQQALGYVEAVYPGRRVAEVIDNITKEKVWPVSLPQELSEARQITENNVHNSSKNNSK